MGGRVVEVGDREGKFLVEGQDFETLGGGDGEGGVEQVDGVGVAPDVELVEFAEEGGGAPARGGPGGLHHAAETGAHGGVVVVVAVVGGVGGVGRASLAVNGLEDFEDGGYAFAFLVEDQLPVFHPALGEESDVSGTGEFLGGALCGGAGGVAVCGGGGAGREDGIEVVSDEGFVGEDEEEGEVFEDSDLGDTRGGDGLEKDD